MVIQSKVDVFSAKQDGYRFFRIPAIVQSPSGYIYAFCEGRKNSCSDNGRIDIVMRRSRDGGATWGKLHIVATDGVNTLGNPCPIVDRETGCVCLVFCKNFADDKENQILSGEKQPRTVWKTFSNEVGLKWSEPERIANVRLDHWTWYATGPGHGIQTTSGRYIVPCNHAELDNVPKNVTRSHIIYSDDAGETWQIGGMSDWRTNEASIAETSEGLYMNMRSNRFGAVRAYAVSRDGGITFSESKYDDELIDPYCQGSVKEYGKGVFFCNPASEKKREKLTLRYSPRLWKGFKRSIVIEESFSAYSDLAVDGNGDILILYECGRKEMYDNIVLARVKFLSGARE